MGHDPAVERGVGEYLLASKRCDILSLQQLLRTGRLVVSVSNLVHALQRERGASNLYVASGGAYCTAPLDGLVDESLGMERQFRERLAEIDTETGCLPGGSRLFSRIAYAIQGLEEVARVRNDVAALRMTPDGIIEGYSALIHCLLALVFEAADTSADPDIARTLVAMFNLMQGKEFAGQERAIGAAGFAQGQFDDRRMERLRHLIDSQERCFQLFADFADEETRAQWQETPSAACAADLERLRRIAFSSGAEGVGDVALSERWFDRASERIDALKGVEDRLETRLMALCECKLADARSELNSHQDHIETLAREPAESRAFAVFVNDDPARAPLDPEPGTYITDGASPQLGRSLMDLVHSQAVRLQAVEEELDQARAALAERKTIEKAKGLVMRHRGMTEEQAYAFLRQIAMAQSRRLAEVAEDTLNMAHVFREPEAGRR